MGLMGIFMLERCASCGTIICNLPGACIRILGFNISYNIPLRVYLEGKAEQVSEKLGLQSETVLASSLPAGRSKFDLTSTVLFATLELP